MSTEDQPTQIPVDAPPPAASDASTSSSGPLPEGVQSTVDEKPELLVLGAFGGAFLLAQVLKRIGGGS